MPHQNIDKKPQHLPVWPAWTGPHSSNCWRSDCFSWQRPALRFSRRPRLCSVAALEMRRESRVVVEPLTLAVSVVPARKGRCRRSWAHCCWMERWWTAPLTARVARAVAGQMLRSRRAEASLLGTLMAAIAGTPRCACHHLPNVALSLTESSKERYVSHVLALLRTQNKKLSNFAGRQQTKQ